MSVSRAVQYYHRRVLDYLEQFGCPLRSRSLLFYERAAEREQTPVACYGEDGVIGPVSAEEFRQLRWAGDPDVIKEAATWRTPEPRWAIVAKRRDELDAFCWIEAGVADILFFDMQSPLPAGVLYLSRMWVFPSCRGQGLGRKLLKFSASYGVDVGGKQLISACVPHNHSMKRLLPDLGWTYQRRIDYLRSGPAMCFSIYPEGAVSTRVFSTREAARHLMGG